LGGGDRAFLTITFLGGLAVLGMTVAVGVFLAAHAAQALGVAKWSFLTTQSWQPDVHRFGIAAVITGTVLIAVVALVLSFPLALGTALFISEIAPNALKRPMVFVVDLLAAVPSVVYGIWGLVFLEGHVVGLSHWLNSWLGWIPIFHVPGAHPNDPNVGNAPYGASTFIAAIVVAIMMTPIQCSIMREAFTLAPIGEREGAYALGATRWGMIKTVVLPFGKGGVVGGTILGLGRALGETIAVLLILSPVFRINWHILGSGGNSVAALIASYYSEASGFGLSALMAAGLALFLLTMVVNFTASAIIARSRSGSMSEV
jgi:phosphate transport system permease protein